MPRQLPYGDKKFYYGIHCNRQRAMGNEPLSYIGFIHRLLKGMNLHDAIYEPKVECQVRKKEFKPTPEDNTRRRQLLNEQNVMILDFDEIEELERKYRPENADKGRKETRLLPPKPNPKMPNKIKMPKPKKTLWDRFISLFK